MEFDMYPLSNRSMIAAMLLLTVCSSCPALASPAPVSSSASAATDLKSDLMRGDLVKLRSGGPLMTVSEIKGDQIQCVWTDESGQANDASFPADVLQRY
jgi:uncharacterized protein YodC (DUF2158 family)